MSHAGRLLTSRGSSFISSREVDGYNTKELYMQNYGELPKIGECFIFEDGDDRHKIKFIKAYPFFGQFINEQGFKECHSWSDVIDKTIPCPLW